MLLDPETWDLVQHVDSLLARRSRRASSARGINPELMSDRVIEITTPRSARARPRSTSELRGASAPTSARSRRAKAAGSPPPARTRSASSSVSGSRPGTVTGSSSTSSSTSRGAELIFGICTSTQQSTSFDEAIQVVNGLSRPPARVPCALGLLAILARRADRAALLEADGLLRLPSLGRAAALCELRGVRRGGGAAGADRLHRRLHAHLVGHPPPSPPGDDRAADLRCGHADRGCGRPRRVLPGAREDALRAHLESGEPVPSFHRILTTEEQSETRSPSIGSRRP